MINNKNDTCNCVHFKLGINERRECAGKQDISHERLFWQYFPTKCFCFYCKIDCDIMIVMFLLIIVIYCKRLDRKIDSVWHWQLIKRVIHLFQNISLVSGACQYLIESCSSLNTFSAAGSFYECSPRRFFLLARLVVYIQWTCDILLLFVAFSFIVT